MVQNREARNSNVGKGVDQKNSRTPRRRRWKQNF
jgi:hypothetical protein